MVKKVLASSLDPNGSTESPLKPSFFPVDVTNEEQIQQMFEQVKKQYGKLDVLINCAGIGIATRTYNMNKVFVFLSFTVCFSFLINSIFRKRCMV